ncbi:MAG: hypothetical protein Q7T86_18235 [Hyphomicrobiaceae bacterium]|nr:hypothetical protein [Hyphomicrobiaceae bacterium]
MRTFMKYAAAFSTSMILAATAAQAKGASPFAGLAGGWSGGGTASFDGGRSEKLRCTATYRPGSGGNTLAMTIRCANASLNVQLNGNLRYNNGRVSGSWSESSTGAGGSAAGRAGPSSLRLRIGGDLSGNLSVSFSGASQSVSIATNNSAFRRASFNLRRR